MKSCDRSAGGPRWRPLATWVVMPGRIIRGSFANTSSRSCGPAMRRPSPRERLPDRSEANRGSMSSRPASPPISLWPSQRGTRNLTTWVFQLAVGKDQSVRDAVHRGHRLRMGPRPGRSGCRGMTGVEFHNGLQPGALENWHLDAAPRGGLRLFRGRPTPPCPTQRRGGAASHSIPFNRRCPENPDTRASCSTQSLSVVTAQKRLT